MSVSRSALWGALLATCAACHGSGTTRAPAAVSSDVGAEVDAQAPDVQAADAAHSDYLPGPSIPAARISESPVSLIEAETHLAVSWGGVICAVWIGFGAQGTGIGYTFSFDDGHSWLPPELLLPETPGHGYSDPVVTAKPDGGFLVTFMDVAEQGSGGPTQTFMVIAESEPGSSTLGPVTAVGDPSTQSNLLDKPWITTTTAGSAIATWVAVGQGAGVFVGRREKGAKTWTTTTAVQDGIVRNMVYPCAQPGTKRVWMAYDAQDHGVGLRWSDDDGASWPEGNRTEVTEQGESDAFDEVSCASDGKHLWVLYGVTDEKLTTTQNAEQLKGIRIARSDDGGKTFALHTDVHDMEGGVVFLHPALAIAPSGALDVTYYAGASNEDSKGSLRRTRSLDGGASFGPSSTVVGPLTFTTSRSKPTWLGDYTGLAWAGNSLCGTAVDNREGQAHVAFWRLGDQRAAPVWVTDAQDEPVDPGPGYSGAAAPKPLWIDTFPSVADASFGQPGTAPVSRLCSDGGSGVLGGGSLATPLDLGGGKVQVAGAADAVVSHFGGKGEALWTKSWGKASKFSSCAGLSAAAQSGSVALVNSDGALDYGGGTFGGGAPSAAVLRLDTSGAYQWGAPIANGNPASGLGIAATADGGALVSFSCTNGVQLAADVSIVCAGNDVAVARYDASGKAIWAANWGDSASQSAVAIGAAADGGAVVAGRYQGVLDFGLGALPTVTGKGGGFLAALDASGKPAWSKALPTAFTANNSRLAVGSGGAIVLGLTTTASLDFGSGALPYGGDRDIVLAVYSPQGQLKWAKSFGDASTQAVYGLAVDGNGRILMGGSMRGKVDFGGGPLVAAGAGDAFLAAFGPDGQHLWSTSWGGFEFVGRCQAVAFNPNGGFFASGTWQGGVEVGPFDFSVTSHGDFLAAYPSF